jgi:hypothetical protein
MNNPDTAAEPAVDLPPSERKEINSMAEKFRNLTQGIEATPASPQAAKSSDHQAQPAAADANTEPKAAAPDVMLPGEVKGKARKAFETLEQLKNKFQKDAEAAQKKLAEFEKGTKPVAEYEKLVAEHGTLKASLAERDEIIKRAWLAEHPTFRAHYESKSQAAIAEARAAAGEHDAEELDEILKLPAGEQRDTRVSEFAVLLDDSRADDLRDAYRSLKRIESEKAAELQKAGANVEILKQQAAAQAREQEIAELRRKASLVQFVKAELAQDLAGMGTDEAQGIVTDIEKFVRGADAKVWVDTLVSAGKWRASQKAMREKDELITKLQNQLNEIQSSTPGVRPSTTTSQRRASPPLDNSDLGQKFRQLSGQAPTRRAA